MNIWLILGIVGGLILILTGLFIYFSARNKGNKFLFKLHLPDERNTRDVYAVLRRDPNHPAQKEFYFKDYNLRLTFRAPNRYENGKSVRDIAFNDKQEFEYITVGGIENNHITRGLDPEEKQIALHRLKEYSGRYDNDMSRKQALQFFGMIGMTIIMVIALTVSVVFYARAVGDSVDVAQANKEVAASLNTVASQIADVTEEQAIITALLRQERDGLADDVLSRPLE